MDRQDNNQNRYPYKKLFRSETDKMIAGVCGGLGQYFEIDPIVFRLVFVLLALLNGIGILLYIVLIIIIPKEGTVPASPEDTVKRAAETLGKEAQDFAERMKGNKTWANDKKNLVGVAIIAIGLVVLAGNFVSLSWLNFTFVVSVLLVVVGFFIMFRK